MTTPGNPEDIPIGAPMADMPVPKTATDNETAAAMGAITSTLTTMPTALPSPPFIAVPNIHNFRGLLTSLTSDPILYRSAFPGAITPSGIQTLHALHITTVFDLRSDEEVQSLGALADIPGIQRFHVPAVPKSYNPVFSESGFFPEAMAMRFQPGEDTTAGFIRQYTNILESGVPAFTIIFEFLRDAPAGQKCLVHCTAGKDRTGVVCALLLMLARCTDEVIAEEYALTDIALKDVIGQLTEKLTKMAVLNESREFAEKMVGARKENILAFIRVVKEKFGSVEEYLKGKCGFGDEDVESLKEKIGDAE